MKLRSSSLARYEACPASYWLEKSAPSSPDSADSIRGTNMHAFVLEGKPVNLSPSDLDIAETAREIIAGMYETPADVSIIEQSMEIEINGVLITGHPDLVEIRGGVALIADLKFGFNKVSDASRNLQVLAYALMVAKAYRGVEVFDLAIVQPSVRGQGSRACFTRRELVSAWERILTLISSIELVEVLGNPIPAPSEDACRYCPALAICPAHRQQIATLAVVDTDAGRWELATPDEKLALYRTAKAVKKAIARIEYLVEEEARANLDAFGGAFRLTKGRKQRTLTDIPALFRLLSSQAQITGEEFAQCVKPVMGELEPLAKKKTGMKGKAWNQFWDGLLDQVSTVETTKGSVELIG
jgi:hypothetical protein